MQSLYFKLLKLDFIFVLGVVSDKFDMGWQDRISKLCGSRFVSIIFVIPGTWCLSKALIARYIFFISIYPRILNFDVFFSLFCYLIFENLNV